MSHKVCIIDTETTGLDPKKNGIVQIAGEIRSKGAKVPFSFPIAPFEADILSLEALEVNGLTAEALWHLPKPADVHRQFLKLLGQHIDKFDKRDKLWFVGYNANFDYQFVREWWLKCGDRYFGSWFWHPPLDLMTFAGFRLLMKRTDMANFKLATVAAELGIPVQPFRLHDAVYDVELTGLLYDKLCA